MTPWHRACEVFPHWRNDPPDPSRIGRARLSLERDVSAFSAEMFRESGPDRAATRRVLRRMIPQLRAMRRIVAAMMRERAEAKFNEAA